jgi:hypothetical protein
MARCVVQAIVHSIELLHTPRPMPRTVLIYDPLLGIFLCDDGQWTCDPHSARDFLTTFAAVSHCVREQLSGVQVIIKSAGQINTVLKPLDIEAWRN